MIEGTLPNDYLVYSLVCKMQMFYNGSDFMDVMRSSVHIKCVCMFKKTNVTCRFSGRVSGARQHDLKFVCFFVCLLLFFFYRTDVAQTVRMHMLIWNFVGHVYSWTPSHTSCKSFYTLKTQRP